MQSMPLGSSVEYTKQLKAALNSSPQGPCAMPPRQGQSQLISPVSGLKAPCCEASSSSAPAPPVSGGDWPSAAISFAGAEGEVWVANAAVSGSGMVLDSAAPAAVRERTSAS